MFIKVLVELLILVVVLLLVASAFANVGTRKCIRET